MKRKQIFYTLIMAAGLLTACGEDDERIPAEPQTQSAADGGQAPADLTRHISVEVSERPMAEEGTAEGRSLTTRAAITTTETLRNFTMKGVYDGQMKDYSVVKKSAGEWTVDPNTWLSELDDNTKVQFYAYTNGTFYSINGTPFIDFTVLEDASKQYDLLVATNSVAHEDHNGTVPLTFDHACAALAFNISMSNTLSGKLELAGKTLTVTSIVLKNVCNKGKYNFGTTFNGSTWSDVEGSANYTLDNSNNMVITTNSQALSSNYLFMIPQKRPANGTVGTYLEISYTVSGQEGSTAIIPLTVDWEKSTQYTINIKLGTKLITW